MIAGYTQTSGRLLSWCAVHTMISLLVGCPDDIDAAAGELPLILLLALMLMLVTLRVTLLELLRWVA